MQYIRIHKGPEFMVHLKYVGVLNAIFVTMIFGFGMPILFPICAVALFLRYLLEVSCLYYSYNVSK